MINQDRIVSAVSEARFRTYIEATSQLCHQGTDPLELYMWNAKVSSAFLMPLHLCEVAVRNRVVIALEEQYGHNWPFAESFRISLARNERITLTRAARSHGPANSIIPELKFQFWQSMFTSRHFDRLWKNKFHTIMLGADTSISEKTLMQNMRTNLDIIRKFRNRIAHHEPIFSQNLSQNFELIKKIIHTCCPDTSAWMDAHQEVRVVLNNHPFL